MINDRDLRFQLVQRKFFFPPPLPIKSRLLICGGSNKYRRLLSLFRERFIHAERHVNWHVQGAKQHVASPTASAPPSNLPCRFYLGRRTPHSSPQVAIHAFNAPRPGRLFRSSCPYPRYFHPTDGIIPRPRIIPVVPMLNSRVRLPNLLDDVDSIHYRPFDQIYALPGIGYQVWYRSDIALSLELIVPSLKYLLKFNIHHLHVDRIQIWILRTYVLYFRKKKREEQSED